MATEEQFDMDRQKLKFFGIELEIDNGGNSTSNGAQLLDICNSDFTETIYLKHDGSIAHGFEIVTHPMTVAYHLTRFPWEKLVKAARNMGYLSHKCGTCGLHIHVNRSFFGADEEEQDINISKVLFFIENNWDYILQFSRRSVSNMERWASRYGRFNCP